MSDGPTINTHPNDLRASWGNLQYCRGQYCITDSEAREIKGATTHEDRADSASACHLTGSFKWWEVYLSIAIQRHVAVRGYESRRETGFPSYLIWIDLL
jgi:hypothetical protein